MKTKMIGASAMMLVLGALLGCSGPPPAPKTFVLWQIEDVYAGGKSFERPTSSSKKQIEGDLDRVACELIQTKYQDSYNKLQRQLVDNDRELIRLGGTPAVRDWTIAVYKCVETGLEPESKEPKS